VYKFAISRPIATLMAFMVFIVFGLISYFKMPVALFPNVDFPVVSVQTIYPGADSLAVESKVTDRLEEAISGIDGIKKIKSTSYDGFSSIVVQFELEKDLDEATNDVRDKIGAVELPDGAKKPTVRKLGIGGEVINLFVATKDGDEQALMRLVKDKIKPKLQRIQGVGEVKILGYRSREIRIFLDPNQLAKYKITASELQNIVSANNFSLGAGNIENSKEVILVKLKADANTIDELKSLIIKPGVRLGDVAKVKDGLSDLKTYSSLNGKIGVTLVVKKISGKNSLDIIKSVKKLMPQLQDIAGKNYTFQLVNDKSDKILVNMHNVTFDLIYGAILAILIVFLFLRNVRATFVSALAIPVSVIGTFAIINWLGYDLNRLTMIGLTLAIGIFIDDAIVVIENITKKMEEGKDAITASKEGISEIAFSILAISAVLLAVFVPVAFMDGIVGLFFNSFAMTVASGIVLSFFVATMLIPSAGARVLKAQEGWFFRVTEGFFKALESAYAKVLALLLRFKLITIIATVAILVASFGLKVGMDFMPIEDNGEFRVKIKAPIGTSLEAMKTKVTPLLKEIQSDKLTKYAILSIAYDAAKEPHKAKIYVKLIDKQKRLDMPQAKVIEKYRKKFAKIKDLNIKVEKLPPFETGESVAPVQVVITGDDFKKLDKISKELMQKMSHIKGLVGIDRDYEEGKPQYDIKIDQEAATRFGVNAKELANLLYVALSSDRAISYFQEDGKEFDITMRLKDRYREKIDYIKSLKIRSNSGVLVPIDSLIKIEKKSKIASIKRYDMEHKVMVSAFTDGVSLNVVVKEIEKEMKRLLPKGYSYRFNGDVEHMQDTAKAFAGAVSLAVILIYLILAALYESFIQPIIIMVALPLSFTGVMVALYLSNNNFSLFVMIGIILLLGMVGKNAILVVDYANRAIKEGLSLDRALLDAGKKRLRPILMTTVAMIGAMAPLAFIEGPGFESNSPMALAIIGGLVSSTILTLLVVPAIYKLLYPIDRWLRKWYEI